MAESGRIVTYRELDERSNRLAHLLRDRGLRRGDHIAILAENHERFFDALWAAARSGHTGGQEWPTEPHRKNSGTIASDGHKGTLRERKAACDQADIDAPREENVDARKKQLIGDHARCSSTWVLPNMPAGRYISTKIIAAQTVNSDRRPRPK